MAISGFNRAKVATPNISPLAVTQLSMSASMGQEPKVSTTVIPEQLAMVRGRAIPSCVRPLKSTIPPPIQAAEAAEQQRQAQQQEQDDNDAEIYNHLTGNILTENPDVAKSLLGPHRMLIDRWKGMRPEQVEAVKKIRAEQCKETQVSWEDQERTKENHFYC